MPGCDLLGLLNIRHLLGFLFLVLLQQVNVWLPDLTSLSPDLVCLVFLVWFKIFFTYSS
jgi:hypothetical protein